MTSTHIIFLPGEATIDPIEAIQMGLVRLRRATPRLSQVRNQFSQLSPVLTKTIAASVRPLRVLPKLHESRAEKARRVRRELLDAGVTTYGLLKSESRFLPKILHENEHIKAVIYGQHGASSAMLAATNERVIYLDKKPMVELFDEVSYEVISGIAFDVHVLFATVILHTPVRNYDFHFVNLRCAEKFARHIEKQRLENSTNGKEQVRPAPPVTPSEIHPHELNDMAGYYWLPSDEEERRKLQQTPV